ncbi:hypothetical protein ABIF70_006406 [Bradyrhizobium japonicum]
MPGIAHSAMAITGLRPPRCCSRGLAGRSADGDRAAQAAQPDRKSLRAATQVEGEAVDLYHFTSVIMRSLDEEGRKRIVQMMWELVYADGQVSEFEDNVVWRASDLLGIAQRDRIDLKHAVANRAGGQVKDGAVGG